MLRWRGLVRIVVATALAMALSGVVVLAQDACTRTYRGDLVLEGNQRLVITEGVLCVGGDIILRDNARLEISNATLYLTGFAETLHESFVWMSLYDDSYVLMRNVRIEVPGSGRGGLWVTTQGSSSASFDRVDTIGDPSLWVNAGGSSRAAVEGSTVRMAWAADRASLELLGVTVDGGVTLSFNDHTRVELQGLRGGHYESWELPGSSGTGIRLAMRDTNVAYWTVELSEQAHVAIHDSELAEINLYLRNAWDVLDGLRPGHYDSWQLQEAGSSSGLGNLILSDTTVVGGWAIGIDSRTRPITLRDSYVGIQTWSSNVRVRIEDSALGALAAFGSQLSLECVDVQLFHGVSLDDSRVSITGSLAPQGEDLRILWTGSTVGREYEVQVRDNNGDPVRGVRIGLEDPNGRVTHRTTDQEGVVRFTIWFYNTNYDRTWHLLVPQGNTTARVPITLLTSTPVEVTSW